ncbi:hypothetical protein HA402_000851 [Bradysia odoriphaga]|nr:hypothetical protein HA402_000851 [Bradysia odoriphaga]
MNPDPGYLYTIEVKLSTQTRQNVDIYRMKFGARTLRWTDTALLINDKPVYFRGLGKHEDSDIRCKGLDLALLTRDFNLLRWIGANAYRTSHYPYSEESMEFADEHGIMIIDECALSQTNVAIDYTEELLQNHKANMEELIHRDRNHPNVIMWSIANEPRSDAAAAIDHPIVGDGAAPHLDIVSFNRYNAWYIDVGRLDTITNRIVEDAREYHAAYAKPMILQEYGADTPQGLHLLPVAVWSEEFQTQSLSKYFEAFDNLRNEGFFIGEFIWNFADFKTFQSITRVGGNKKGVFTRNRQPKAAAHLLRKRYFQLALEIDNYRNVPDDIYEYTSQRRMNTLKEEL